HVLDGLAEAPDVVVVERRVDLVQQTERRRIELEDREHERHRGQRLLAARQLVDRAVPLARRTRHDRNARVEDVLAGQLQVSVTAAEQFREALLQTGIDAVERVLEARARLAVDLADRRFERFERVGQILELAVQVFLALGLVLELVDGREVHLPEALDLAGDFREIRLPGGHVRFRRHLLIHRGELELRSFELLQQRLAPDLELLRRHAHVFETGTRDLDCTFRVDAALIERAHASFSSLDCRTSTGELLLDLHPPLQRFFQRCRQRLQRCFAFCQLARQLVAPLLQLFELIAQPLEACRNRLQRRALRLDLDRHFLRTIAIGLRLRALERQVLAQLFTLLLQLDARGLELRHLVDAFLQSLTCFRDGAGTALVIPLQFLGLGADALHSFGGLLRLRAQRAHLRVRIASDTMQTVDLFLERVATLLMFGEPGARIDELGLGLRALLFGVGDDVAQSAHFFLATDDARMHVLVATDAQPLAPDPHAVTRNDRLAAQQGAALFQRFGQRVDGDDAGQQRRDGRRSLHARQQPVAIDLLSTRAARGEE